MALQFIFGNPGSGKSHYLYEHIIRESMKHPDINYIILVPEQFTMQTQKELVLRHPRHGIMNIDVLSFARLAFRVLEETGNGSREILDDEGKSLIFISSEIEEMLRTCNRMAVLRDGQKVGEIDEADMNQMNVMKAIAGGEQ